MTRITRHFPRLVWLNPEPENRWQWTPSVAITRELVGNRMFPLTLDGLDRAMRELRQRGGPGGNLLSPPAFPPDNPVGGS
jgi:uncharacterized protein with von Willebrand factor type A (vWA) domain